VKAALKKVDAVFVYGVDQAVLLSNPPAPAAREFKLQRLRLADSLKRIAEYSLN
jgi:hypothetical protein